MSCSLGVGMDSTGHAQSRTRRPMVLFAAAPCVWLPSLLLSWPRAAAAAARFGCSCPRQRLLGVVAPGSQCAWRGCARVPAVRDGAPGALLCAAAFCLPSAPCVPFCAVSLRHLLAYMVSVRVLRLCLFLFGVCPPVFVLVAHCVWSAVVQVPCAARSCSCPCPCMALLCVAPAAACFGVLVCSGVLAPAVDAAAVSVGCLRVCARRTPPPS